MMEAAVEGKLKAAFHVVGANPVKTFAVAATLTKLAGLGDCSWYTICS